MRKSELDQLLEKSVANALGLTIAPATAAPQRRPQRTYPHAHKPKPVVITTRYERVQASA